MNLIDLSNSTDSLPDDGLSRFTQNENNKDEYPNEICSSFSSSADEADYFNRSNYTNDQNQSDISYQNRLLSTWKMNYHEAAIYLQV